MGFLDPLNLLYAFSLVVLVAIYLRLRPRPPLEVSSLMLFEEAPAPASRARWLRTDLLFWLETVMLAAVVLALGGLFISTASVAARAPGRALVFDLGASMGARGSAGVRLDLAKREALRILDSASEGDRLSVAGYAHEARTIYPASGDLAALRRVIQAMRPTAVAARQTALVAALVRSRAASKVDLFTDRVPPTSVLEEAGLASRLRVHQVGSPADNFAIVSLAPGIPRGVPGHVVLRSFSSRSHDLELAVDRDGKPVLRRVLLLGPKEQVDVQFGPLETGGIVRARILSADALSADNERYAYAPAAKAVPALVFSPDPAARDDISRLLLAVNSNFIVSAEDPAAYKPSGATAGQAAIAVMHDCFVRGVRADSLLLVYPPGGTANVPDMPGLEVKGTVSSSELRAMSGAGDADAPVALGPARVVLLPDWMKTIASGNASGRRQTFPLAAVGDSPAGRVGVIAFDVRNHLLLDPDHLQALVTAIDVARRLTAPANLRIVPTGTELILPASGSVKIVSPDGSVSVVPGDRWGRVRFRALQAGPYRVESAAGTVHVYANYYDAYESDLTAAPASADGSAPSVTARAGLAGVPKKPRPLGLFLAAFALLMLVAESAILARRALGWNVRNV